MISLSLLCVLHALCALALGWSSVHSVELQSRDLENRETACIALGNCPGHSDSPSSSTSTSSSTPPPPPPPSSTTASQPSSTLSSPSTPSPSIQDTIQYLLFPKKGASQNDTDTFEKLLINIVGDPGKIFASSVTDVGVVFWAAPLNPDQVNKCADYNLTLDILPDKKIHIENIAKIGPKRRRDVKNRITGNYERRDSLNRQSDAPDQLKVVSQPLNVPVKNLKNFVYRQEAGQGVTVYVHDTGANKDSNEWKLKSGSKRWIFPGNPIDSRYKIDLEENDADPDGHGSCVFSMAVGSKYGTAKNADLVIVKRPEWAAGPDAEDVTEAAALDALIRILNDIKANNLQKKAVVNLSYGYHDDIADTVINSARDLIGQLLAEDAVVVTASGNEASDGRPDIDDYPALFARDFPNLIVVGATDNDGKTWESSQGGSLLSMSGPGKDIVCASGTGSAPQLDSGTSFPTGSVSGLAAYFLSLPELQDQLQVPGKTAQNVKDYILNKARPRIDGEIKVLYNGENSDQK